MSGTFRRAILVEAGDNWARAEVEDDFHHFIVRIGHDGRHVTTATGEAIRHPWSMCPAAASALPALAGMPLSPNPAAVFGQTDPLGQCTHMFEAAGLAVAQAARGPGARRYDLSASEAVEGPGAAELALDGVAVARWALIDGVISDPPALAGLRPPQIRSRALLELDAEEAERRLLLRRAAILAPARKLDVDRFPNAAAMGRGRACFVLSPGVAEQALRRRGSVRDFSTGPRPLADRTASGEAS